MARLDDLLTERELADLERQVHSENAAYVTVRLAPRLIDLLRSSTATVHRLRSVDLQRIAAEVLAEYGVDDETVFHAATRIAERASAA